MDRSAESLIKRTQWNKKYYASHKEYYQEKRLLRKYNITLKQFKSLIASQSYKCAICQGSEHKHKNWCVDHDHQTGDVRGILCNDCNRLLGLSFDSPRILQNAINYLTQRMTDLKEST